MNNKERYNKAFSVLQTSKEINLEENKLMKYNKKMKHRVAIASICGCIALSASGIALAANAFGIRDLVLPHTATTTELTEYEETTGEQLDVNQATNKDVVSEATTEKEKDPALAPVEYSYGEDGWRMLEIQGDEMKDRFPEDSDEGIYIQKMIRKNIFNPNTRYRMHYNEAGFQWITEMYDDMPELCDDYFDVFYGYDDVINLSGFADSPEGKAVAEWEEFLRTYDRNKKILNANDKLDEDWGVNDTAYFVYSQEMADKVREIASKYNLELHTGWNQVNYAEAENLLGGDVLPEQAGDYGAGYSYDDGTVSFDGAYIDSEGYEILYQARNNKKGVFDTVTVTVGDINDYTQEQYTTKDGTKVQLAYSDKDGGIVMFDREDSFFIVCVDAAMYSKYENEEYIQGEFSMEKFKAFVDEFNFSEIK